jgi:hypothetical protein
VSPRAVAIASPSNQNGPPGTYFWFREGAIHYPPGLREIGSFETKIRRQTLDSLFKHELLGIWWRNP